MMNGCVVVTLQAHCRNFCRSIVFDFNLAQHNKFLKYSSAVT